MSLKCLVIFGILFLQSCECNDFTCEIKSKQDSFVQAFQEYDDKWILLPNQKTYTLGKNEWIYLICPGGFTDKSYKTMQVYCFEDGRVGYGNYNDTSFHIHSAGYYDNGKHIFDCSDNSLRSQVNNGNLNCPETSYSMGYKYQEDYINVVDICYKYSKRELLYVHYRYIDESDNAITARINHFDMGTDRNPPMKLFIQR